MQGVFTYKFFLLAMPLLLLEPQAKPFHAAEECETDI